MDVYCIKEGYKINRLNITNDDVSHTSYWDKKRNFAASVYQFPVYQFLNRYIQENRIDTVIDIGCGVGKKLAYINEKNRGLSIVGIDQANPIEYCKNTYNFGNWLVDDFENPILSEKIKAKLIISSDVIEHLINPDLLLSYIKSMLDEEGVVILSTPERDRLRGKKCCSSPNKHHVREWSYVEFEEYLESRGFEVIDHFLQYPVKFGITKIFFSEVVKRALSNKKLKYNQVIVAKVK